MQEIDNLDYLIQFYQIACLLNQNADISGFLSSSTCLMAKMLLARYVIIYIFTMFGQSLQMLIVSREMNHSFPAREQR